jgi:hypothetical protein
MDALVEVVEEREIDGRREKGEWERFEWETGASASNVCAW